jgi:hypothetical protein
MRLAAYNDAFAIEDQLVRLGPLPLPTGRVVGCDPYFCDGAVPFDRVVEPGEYDVQLCRVSLPRWGRRIALARILLAPDRPAVALERAAVAGVGEEGYFVESGVGSFMDELTRDRFARVLAEHYRLHPRGNYYTDVLAAEFRRQADPGDPHDLGRWNVHRLPSSSLSVAMFASGLGDGRYASYWALDEDGVPVSLTTDFHGV